MGSITKGLLPTLPLLIAATCHPATTAAQNSGPPAPAQMDIKVYASGDDGISAPLCLYCPQPSYPKPARKHHIQGTVTVDVRVNRDGKITDPKVTKTPGYGLEDEALKILTKWRMKPCAKPDGEPVACTVSVEVDFHLYR
jgi:TonB family protein